MPDAVRRSKRIGSVSRASACGWKADIDVSHTADYASAMIWNIIDNRKRKYRWREVNAIVEATEHDNSCQDADQAPESDVMMVVDYEALEAVSVEEAIKWADGQPCPVTLYLYDLGDGLTDDEHFTNQGVRFEGD